jgi:hypothetical protein
MRRTVLSTANNAAEYRTLVLARREMMDWTQFQLEPSALRAPDPFILSKKASAKDLVAPERMKGREPTELAATQAQKGATVKYFTDLSKKVIPAEFLDI